MSSVFTAPAPTEATLQSFQDELNGNVFRNISGLYAKYFQGKPWSAIVENKLHAGNSATIISKLSTDLSGVAHFDALADWLADFQTLFFTVDQSDFRWHSRPLRSKGSTPHTGISLETSDIHFASGGTRVFGEFHHDTSSAMADDDEDFLRLSGRAQYIFKSQSARCFVHGFLVRGTALELWIFDRSGAYSSERLDLAEKPDLLVRVLAGYALMSDEEAGFNTFVKRVAPESESYVTFHQYGKFHLRPDLVATADYIVGLGTTCYAASTSRGGKPDIVIKFSWREEEDSTEVRLLQRAHERGAGGIIQLLAYQDLTNIASLREGLHFPGTYKNRTFSCIATTPLGRPIRQFASIHELLEVLRDLVKALQSLYLNARILHRDVAIKNWIIPLQHNADKPRGVLLDFNFALDLDNIQPIEPMVGSDGFMAIGILSGEPHTYRHDLESLFYVFLWFAIANDRVHDEANDILKQMSKESRLWKWCSMDFAAVGKDKAADMSPEGFEGILDEFCSDFAPLRGLAKELHA